MKALKIFCTWLITLLLYTPKVKAQENLVIKNAVYIKGGVPLGVFSTHVFIQNRDQYISTLYLTGHKKQHLSLAHGQNIDSLFISNPNGFKINGALKIRHYLLLNTIITLEGDSVLEIGEQARIESTSDQNYIQGWLKFAGEKVFSYPIGVREKLAPIQIKRLNYKVFEEWSLGISLKAASGNANSLDPYSFSTDHYLLRGGIATLDQKQYWDIKTDYEGHIQIEWPAEQSFYKEKKVRTKGLAGWNTRSKNWQLIPTTTVNTKKAAYKKTSEKSTAPTLVSVAFPANKYSKWVLCDCIAPHTPYKALGNFLLTLNGDKINNIVDVSQYPKERIVNFQLYNRQGIMLFKTALQDLKSFKDLLKKTTSYTGTYYYIVHLKAPKQIEQGYLYLIKK